MKIIVYRDAENKVINIGDWDYMPTIDDNGDIIVNNPIPDGSTSKIEEIIVNKDGSRSVVAETL